jgi:Phycobilisome protein
MTSKRKSRGVKATPNGLELLHKAKGERKMSYEEIAGHVIDGITSDVISEKTVARFFGGTSVEWFSASKIAKVLGLDVLNVVDREEYLVSESIDQIEREGADSKRAIGLIEELEKAFNELKQREEASLPIMEWLKANRKTLSQEAAEAVLRNRNDQENFGSNTDDSDIERFSKDIRKYLQLLYFCLEEGSWELIERVIQESVMPVNWDTELYAEALTFIKNQKINQNFSSESTQEIMLFLDYLIKIIPLRL